VITRPVLLSLLLVARLPAQSNAERVATDWYTRSHDYDLLHQRIELWDFDWGGHSFEGRVTVELRALRPGFDSVVLDAGRLLGIDSVITTGARPISLRQAHVGDTLVIHLPGTLAPGDTARFRIRYHGVVQNGRGLTFIDQDSLPPYRPDQLWSQGESMDNHLWFPTYDFPNDKATWEVAVTVPRRFTVVSNGRRILDRPAPGGGHTVVWRQDQPASTYLASLVIAPLRQLHDHWRGIPIDAYVYPRDTLLARPLFALTPDLIEVYSQLTGVEYPWAKYAQTTVADFFGGMENVSATTLVDWLPDPAAYADRPWYRQILIPHELAHQWFGDYVTTVNWANFWLNEGFAEFLPGQYWGVRQGRLAEEEYYLDEYRQFLEIDARRRMPLAALGSNNVYPRGALVLEMLKRRLGPERFWAGVHRYLSTHALGNAGSDDLRQAFLEATGENLEVFWNEWIYQAGLPEFKVEASWDSTRAIVSLRVRQLQRDTLTADTTGLRYGVPETYHGPVTVRVGTAMGDVTVQAELTAREQDIQVPSIATAPEMVIFDADNTLLKTLQFDQPTAWLATQLRRDESVWNRAWVTGVLAGRRDDPQAIAALDWALREADLPRLRAEAAEALGGATDSATVGALLSALADPAPTVRAAAVGALAGAPGPRVLSEVLQCWTSDTSYAVRAAALGTLVLLDPAHAHPRLEAALGTPSYQDQIADAALGGILRTGDTTLVTAVSDAMARLDNAGHVLALLGSRGSGRALELLGQHLLSPRAVVRRRALQAYRYSLPATLSRPTLTALLAQTSGTAADEIRQVLQQLGATPH
jgi:aminopeptidase N